MVPGRQPNDMVLSLAGALIQSQVWRAGAQSINWNNIKVEKLASVALNLIETGVQIQVIMHL